MATIVANKPKHGSSEVARWIAARQPQVRISPFLGPERIVFITLWILLLLWSYTHTHTPTPMVLPQSQCTIEFLDNSHISEPALELHSRATPSVECITAQSVQLQGEIPEEGRTEEKYIPTDHLHLRSELSANVFQWAWVRAPKLERQRRRNKSTEIFPQRPE